MEVLKEITNTLTRFNVQKAPVISNPELQGSRKNNRYWKAYRGLTEKRWDSEEALAAHFKLDRSGKAFNRFKNELKDKLWNTILYTEVANPEQNAQAVAYQQLLHHWIIAELLRQKGADKAFWQLAHQCLDIARKYDFVKMVVDISAAMKSHCIQVNKLKNDYQKVRFVFNQYWGFYQAEVNLRHHYEAFVANLAPSKGFKKSYAPIAEQLVQEFSEAAEQCNTIQFQFHYRLIHFYAKVLCHDWQQALLVADDALRFFASKKFEIPFYVIGFNHQKVSCLLMLGRHQEARALLDDMLVRTTAFSSNYFKNRELATVNAFYAEDYAEAWNICKVVLLHERFDKIPPMDQESWRIYYGYLCFLAQTDQMELSPQEKGELPKFRLSSWLNDLPLYSVDKRGGQIPILILQTLLLYAEGRWNELDNRIEALRKYRQRNLDPHDEHFRTNCFIQMLELLPKYTQNVKALHAASAPWLHKLSSAACDILDRTYEIEVVPYERQWAWVITMAERQALQLI
jgi:hypothetical protein